MKKNKLILVILLSWLSLSSVVTINTSAVKWPLTEKSITILPQEVGKLSIKDNDDFTLYFTVNITSLSDTPANVSMIMFKGALWVDHKEDYDYLYDHSVMFHENLTDTPNEEDFYHFEYFFYEDDKFYPAFRNNNDYGWIQIEVTVEREEVGRVAYYFAGFVTVIFAGLIFWVYKRKKDLLKEITEEIPEEAPIDSV